MKLRDDCDQIVRRAIAVVQPDVAVRRALEGNPFQGGRMVLVIMGEAVWSTARVACDYAGGRLDGGIITTKHDRTQGPIGSLLIREAGHPVPNQDTFFATEEALALTDGLTAEGTVFFLLSSSDSVLFEASLVPQEEPQSIVQNPLANGVDIVEMNTIRKWFSAVKGGRFAQHYAPAEVFSIVPPDIIDDPLDMIVSGPVCPDSPVCADTRHIAEQYGLRLSSEAPQCPEWRTPKVLDNVETLVTDSVRELCVVTSAVCRGLGYEPVLLTDSLNREARETGAFLVTVVCIHQNTERSLAFLAGGETMVHLTGSDLGGRNQEPALSAAAGIAGLEDTAVFSLGSDDTDDPTGVTGGFVNGGTKEQLARQSVCIFEVLKNNDAHHVLTTCGGLPHTGVTGTNVSGVAVFFIRR